MTAFRRSAICLSLMAHICLLTYDSAAVVIVGPGAYPTIYENFATDYHILSGTQIIGSSSSGPPFGAFVSGSDAIVMQGGGDTIIDGGLFQGGNANYTTGVATYILGGKSLHFLHNSTGTIHDGDFIGGDATGRGFGVIPGSAMVLHGSTLRIIDGYFEGGTGTRVNQLGNIVSVTQAPALDLFYGSRVFMHGGLTSGRINVQPGAALAVFGTNIQFTGSILSGVYVGGQPFSHAISGDGHILVNPAIPEPSAFALSVIACAAVCVFCRRRKSGQ